MIFPFYVPLCGVHQHTQNVLLSHLSLCRTHEDGKWFEATHKVSVLNILQNLIPPQHTPPLPTSSTELEVFVPTCGTFTFMNLLSTLPRHILHSCCSQPHTPYLKLIPGYAILCCHQQWCLERDSDPIFHSDHPSRGCSSLSHL